MEFPRFICRMPGTWKLESGSFEVGTARTAEEYAAKLSEGWFGDQYEAKAAFEAAESDKNKPKPPSRAELEAKATELGLKFDGRTSDRKLAEMVSAT